MGRALAVYMCNMLNDNEVTNQDQGEARMFHMEQEERARTTHRRIADTLPLGSGVVISPDRGSPWFGHLHGIRPQTFVVVDLSGLLHELWPHEIHPFGTES